MSDDTEADVADRDPDVEAERDEEREPDERDEVREERAADVENVDNYRDEEPFES